MKIKICGLKHPDNIAEITALGPDFIGLIFHEKSPRYVGNECSEISTGNFKKVGVFVDETAEKILETALRFGLYAVQLHGAESPEFCRKMKASGLRVIKAFSVGAAFDFGQTFGYQDVCDFFLFDAKGKNPGGNGIQYDWDILKNYVGETPFLLSGGLRPSDAEQVLAFRHPMMAGVDLNSGFEIEPGLKNVKWIERFMKKLTTFKKLPNLNFSPDKRGFYGQFGGAFVPEMLHPNVEELQNRYLEILASPSFQADFDRLLRDYAGRPTPLYLAPSLSERYGCRVFLKREDLNHTGSHKINNAIGQVLLAQRLGKRRIIAETGAGQHGVATATVCALMGLECVVYMGEVDIKRQAPNVARMQMLGATVVPAISGSRTLKDATNEAIRDWINNPENTYYIIGSTVGPHPYPDMVARFQSVISAEIRRQLKQQTGRSDPDLVVACVGGGSNAAGAFYHFLKRKKVRLVGVEAAGHGVDSGKTAATLAIGTPGIIHGSRTFLMQTPDGQIVEPHSISAGLDYPGIGPLHAFLKNCHRAEYLSVTDDEALQAAFLLARTEGIIPALESAHALAALEKLSFRTDEVVVVNLSGRGDKDLETYSTNLEKFQ
ncbi:MAG: tryptophan synthase subunit beta [Saprospiraceae bacterium]|nr:tryptophan synthase subunit beta [Saprospiraceae bacterium]